MADLFDVRLKSLLSNEEILKALLKKKEKSRNAAVAAAVTIT
jgi:hypothetical protein